MIAYLEKSGIPMTLTDAALSARILYERFSGNIGGMLEDSEWGQYLEGIGLGEDVRICARIDSSGLVPVYRDGKVFLER